MNQIKKVLLLGTALVLFSILSIYYRRIKPTTSMVIPLERTIVTVFIHGTFHLPIMPKIAIKGIHGLIDKAVFAKKGLYKVTSLKEHYEQTWTKKLHHYHMLSTLSDAQPEQFPLESLYMFGWSGQLNPAKRLHAAKKLYNALSLVVTEYKQKDGIEPYIQIITHSHGGNVALNLAKINETSDTSLTIDELILLACPVQHETSQLVESAVFKKIYSLHSHWDILQVIDAQGWVPFKQRIKNLFKRNDPDTQISDEKKEMPCFFSERHFALNPKLIQANIYYGMRGMLHVEFISATFMQHLPVLLRYIDAQTDYHPSEKDPDMFVDLNPMIKESRRLRLAEKKSHKRV
jgi:hypothetical protein